MVTLHLRRTKQAKMKPLRKLIVWNFSIGNFKKMKDSLLIRIISFFLSFFYLIVCPAYLNAGEINSSSKESDSAETVQAPNQMTEKQMNDLFGEDPYLGQTSYLQSPEGFSQSD